MPTTLVNLTLNDGTTRQFKSNEPEATYKPGETLTVNGRRKTIVRKSQFTIPAELTGQSWTDYCAISHQTIPSTRATQEAAAA